MPALRLVGGRPEAREDLLAVEEPLELRLHGPDSPLVLAVLMRTPGHDRELLTGWLVSEGLLPAERTLDPDPENPNVWHLHTPEHARLALGARLGVSSSACGVCGSGSVERLAVRAEAPRWTGGLLDPAMVAALPERLRAAQPGFAATGGLHAAGLFTPQGKLLAAFEDVGRHNATDKAVGWATLRGDLPLSGQVLAVSSRAGFEIVQKAVTAGAAVVVAVGAASSLAADTAATFGVTLCAFTREGRFTVYAAPGRLALPGA
ncbi:formate dehydrogenase accessory sulfurtransferase FdhD [Deinococcus gobiensis]|uniref:formate dehydrogenase accessory sulfurtransferase FdhD n=1 Tax=Deinococcus gobiensis TaxID=502394 RepID=UPI0002E997FF|nr:formate dehydrogenase accessory sulfurtransferase FdhD [Deinococcus gobiensis]